MGSSAASDETGVSSMGSGAATGEIGVPSTGSGVAAALAGDTLDGQNDRSWNAE